MSLFIEYCGRITFTNEAVAAEARSVLKEGKWVTVEGDTLNWVDSENGGTPNSGDTIFLNAGTLENFHRVIKAFLLLDTKEIVLRAMTEDGGLRLSEYNSDTKTFDEPNYKNILGVTQDEFVRMEEKNRDEVCGARENAYDWITEVESYPEAA